MFSYSSDPKPPLSTQVPSSPRIKLLPVTGVKSSANPNRAAPGEAAGKCPIPFGDPCLPWKGKLQTVAHLCLEKERFPAGGIRAGLGFNAAVLETPILVTAALCWEIPSVQLGLWGLEKSRTGHNVLTSLGLFFPHVAFMFKAS